MDLSFSKEESIYKCLSCGSVFPVHDNVACLLPSTLDKRKLNEDRMYQYWANNRENYEDWVVSIRGHTDYSFFKRDFLPRHGQAVGGRILEIGAGLCWASATIKSMFPSVQVVASDVSPTALLRGREVCSLLDSNVDHFIACDVERLPFKDQTFTAVFGASIIHHLPNPQQGLVEVHRVLDRGGVSLGLDFGLGRAAADRIRKTLLKSRFYPTGAAERTFGIVESVRATSGRIFTAQRVSEM